MQNQIDIRLVRNLKTTSKICAFFVLLIGLTATVGWQFDVSAFKRIFPSLPVIAPNTSVFLIIIALLLLVSSFRKKGSAAKHVIMIFSGLISLLGLLTFLEYLTNLNLGVDQLFFASKMGASIVRMSPQSALNFFAVGIAIFFFNSNFSKAKEIGQWILVAIGLVAFASLAGFIYKIAGLYTISPFKGMAAHTAVAFLFAFVSMLFLYPEVGFMRIFVRKGISSLAARRLLAALLAIFIFEFFVMVGRSMGVYNEIYESLIHLVVVAGVFFFLFFPHFIPSTNWPWRNKQLNT